LAKACQILGVNASTLRQWADQGQIRVFRTPGGHRRFSSEDLQAFLERTAHGAAAGAKQRTSVTDTVLRRIRRGLQAGRVASSQWYEPLDEGARGRMRLYGRRLLDVTEAYVSQRRRRPELLEEVRLIGGEYGAELARQGLSLRDVLEAFLFFRRSLMGSLRETAKNGVEQGSTAAQDWQHVEVLADELLLSMAETYERSKHDLVSPVA
jgi:excisionase family DNA binding protein